MKPTRNDVLDSSLYSVAFRAQTVTEELTTSMALVWKTLPEETQFVHMSNIERKVRSFSCDIFTEGFDIGVKVGRKRDRANALAKQAKEKAKAERDEKRILQSIEDYKTDIYQEAFDAGYQKGFEDGEKQK